MDNSTTSQFPAIINLADLTSSQGFEISGIANGNLLGWDVSSAGDVNGDGLDDLVFGAPGVSAPGLVDAGAAYVIFGAPDDTLADMSVSTLDGTNGFTIIGAAVHADAGFSVAAGDVTDDGISDLIIGAPAAVHASGQVYVVYGHAGPFPATINASKLNGTNGFTIGGAPDGSSAGYSLASGDINGDGCADIVIGASGASPNGASQAGSVYVVFGASSGLSAHVDLSTLNGTNGFRIDGVIAGQHLGFSVTTADLTGDGYDDIIIGAPNGPGNAGNVYVIYGHAGGFPAAINVNDLDGTNGFTIAGPEEGTRLGWSVGTADANGDGLPDLVIGQVDGTGSGVHHAGITWVIYGTKAGFPPVVNLNDLTPSEGFEIEGYAYNQEAGCSVSCAGDINGDGIQDILIGAPHGDPIYPDTNDYPGCAYVVFGQKGGFTSPIDLATLNGVTGFRIVDNQPSARFGYVVAAAGDLTGDGYDDLIVGARPDGATAADYPGEAYVIYGHPTSGSPPPPVNQMFTATAGLNSFWGGTGNDYFNLSQGTTDIAYGGLGDNVFYMGGQLNAGDGITGGPGGNTVILAGNYPKLTLGVQTIQGIQTIELTAGYSYNLSLGEDDFPAGQTMTIDGSMLGRTDKFQFSARSDGATDGNLVLIAGAGTNFLAGGNGANTFIAGTGPTDFTGGPGVNDFVFQSLADSTPTNPVAITNFSSATGDKIDLSTLETACGEAFTFIGTNAFDGTPGEIRTVTKGSITLVLLDSTGSKKADFSISLLRAPVLTASDFIIPASPAPASEVLTGSATNSTLVGGPGTNSFISGPEADTMTGGPGANIFVFQSLSDSTVPVTGRDTITNFSSAAGDKIDLSALEISLGESFDFIGSASFDHIAGEIRTQTANGYTLVLLDTTGDDQPDFCVQLAGAPTLTASDFVIPPVQEANQTLVATSADPVITGGTGNDTLVSGPEADTLTAGSGTDTFVYSSLADSSAAASGRDTIVDFSQGDGDKIDLSALETACGESFTFIGSNAFNGSPGEVRSIAFGANTLVQLDSTGDENADFSILLLGQDTLTANDFIIPPVTSSSAAKTLNGKAQQLAEAVASQFGERPSFSAGLAFGGGIDLAIHSTLARALA